MMLGLGLSLWRSGGGIVAAPTFSADPTAELSSGIEADGFNTGTGTVGTITGDGVSIAWSWQRDEVDIPGASGTGETVTAYTFVGADVGALIRLRVTATNAGGSATAYSSDLGQILWHPAVLFETSGRNGHVIDPLNAAGFWRDTAKTQPVTASGQFVNAHVDRHGNGLTLTNQLGGNGMTYTIETGGRRYIYDALGAFNLRNSTASDAGQIVGGSKNDLFFACAVYDELAGAVALRRATMNGDDGASCVSLVVDALPSASSYEYRLTAERVSADATVSVTAGGYSFQTTDRRMIAETRFSQGQLVIWVDGAQRNNIALASSGSGPANALAYALGPTSGSGARGRIYGAVFGDWRLSGGEKTALDDWLNRRMQDPPSTGSTGTPEGS